MIYLRWGKDDIVDLESVGLAHVVTECDIDGSVLREIGFDRSGNPMHRAPDPVSAFFLFDLQSVDVSRKTACMSTEQFNAAWRDAGLSVGTPSNHRQGCT
ncbi:hypothetical protein [Pseudoxanthomonas sp. PXM02]|uniref:hypothetical protein n=1 Tax=Pseudoxanthomonas sp. PXM02 TaxID=2769294 RepID=UPI00177C1331|nr:hypothetical protein [Pseudoxanthomonas sp. PXM02]MBD9477883.1 hypothetical protein [Pseudoxanthomonas sp. PXM02]